MSGYRTNRGKDLQRHWGIPAVQTRYHKDGTWYMPLTNFPGALCDPHGYVVFDNEAEFKRSPSVSVGTRVNVRPHLSQLPGYIVACS